MVSKVRIACAALLAVATLPAFALELGQIQVRSALDQPLVAAIPLHPKSLTELEGLSVGLAPAQDFQRAGLALTPTDRTLRFRVVTDNNGAKLILVTSSQPITDPYLDFLVQVNTRTGKQVREFVVLLNPVIAASAPAVQAAPVASVPATRAPAQLPAPSQFPQPSAPASARVPTVPSPQPVRQPPSAAPRSVAPAVASSAQIDVHRGDTLWAIAKQASAETGGNINQMMLALQAVNPDAFSHANINDLKAGAILRIPTRDEVDRRSAATAAADVRRQNASWRAATPHAATLVEGSAAEAAANAAPKATARAAVSDHLTLVPPTGTGRGANNRPGAAGGTGTATVAGLDQQLQNSRDALVSLQQANGDLQSRIESLKAISTKTDKLLSLKDATIAELQQQLGHAAPGTSTAAVANKLEQTAKPTPAKVATTSTPWYRQSWAWMAGIVILLVLLAAAALGRGRRRPDAALRGPLADPDDVAGDAPEEGNGDADADADADAAAADGGDVPEMMPAPPEPVTVAAELQSADAGPSPPASDAVYEPVATAPAASEPEVAAPVPASIADAPAPPREPEPAPELPAVDVVPASPAAAEPAYSSDPVDTKLDLARAYIDMGDPVGARAMLEEVLGEGSQVQQDEARRLLANVDG